MSENKMNLEELVLKAGNHKSIDEGACVMEMVSYLANEPWSDHPKCACPILTEYAIRFNDRFNDEHRQKLKPLIPLLVGSKLTDEVQIARKRLIRWRNVTVLYPEILDLLKLTAMASDLRKFENNLESMAKASNFLESNKAEILKTANAYAYANANTYTYTYTYTYAYANANAYAKVDAYTYTYPYTYADSYAWREKVATIAVETLRLACELASY